MKKALAWACSIALLTAVGTCALADDTAPKISAAKNTGTVAVDGKLDESGWQINNELTYKIGDPNNKVTFGTMWDEKNLYVGIHVVDDKVFNTHADNVWDDDEVEVFIDGNMTKGDYDDQTAQFTFRYDDPQTYLDGVAMGDSKGVQHASLKTNDGYNVEVSIPWAAVGGMTVSAGKTIGFTVHNDDKDVNDSTVACSDILAYTDPNSGDAHNSSNWAELTLAAPVVSSSSSSSASSASAASSSSSSSASSTSAASSSTSSSASSTPAASSSKPAVSSTPAASSSSSSSISNATSSAASSSDSSITSSVSSSDSTAAFAPVSSGNNGSTAIAGENSNSTSGNPNTGSKGIMGAVVIGAISAAVVVISRRMH